LLACACALVATLGVTACGSSSSSSTNASASASQQGQRQGGRRGFFQLDAKTRACLQKQGVTLPTGRRPGNGPPPGGGNGQPPGAGNGQPPSGGGNASGNGQRPRFNRDPAQLQKLRTAMQKCGVTFPNRGGGGNGAAPQGTNTSTSAT
jgi:hypothetical protein